MEQLEQITLQTRDAITGLLSAAQLKARQIVVVGCSTSEVLAKPIGSASNLDVANAIMNGLLPIIRKNALFLAVQCCEHLNRALVVEASCAEKYGLEAVMVIPHERAGGALAKTAMERFEQPVVVESISAHAGIDIGDTLIGMHLKKVAVPVRLSIKAIGAAHLTLARTRPKFIGGARAKYDPCDE